MTYEQPSIIDLGDLVEITQGTGFLGASDGTGYTLQGQVGPGGSIVDLSAGILP